VVVRAARDRLPGAELLKLQRSPPEQIVTLST